MLRFVVAALVVCGALGDSLHPVRHDLDEKQVYMIKDSWPMVSKAQDWAVELALKYYKAHPDAHADNPLMKGYSLEELKTRPEFRQYALKMYEFFDIGVRYVHAGPSQGTCKPLEDRSEAYVKSGKTNRQRYVDYRNVLIDHLGVKDEPLTAWNYFMDNILALIFSKFP
jgi:hypothetical protein